MGLSRAEVADSSRLPSGVNAMALIADSTLNEASWRPDFRLHSATSDSLRLDLVPSASRLPSGLTAKAVPPAKLGLWTRSRCSPVAKSQRTNSAPHTPKSCSRSMTHNLVESEPGRPTSGIDF